MRALLTLFFGFIACFLSIELIGQDISDFSYQLLGEKIEVSYTLDGDQNDRYNVALFSSVDGFVEPLQLVSGDIGANIIPGPNKKAIWDAKAEFGEFKGTLSLELRAKFIPFLEFDITSNSKIKRGKDFMIKWKSGSPNEELVLELHKKGQLISQLSGNHSEEGFNWAVPKDLDLKANYLIKALGNDRTTSSSTFQVKRKIPLMVWVVPGVVVIGGVIVLITISSDNGGSNDIADPILPN